MGHHRKQEITFLLTTRCNLECTYCYMPKLDIREHLEMSIDFAVAGLHDFFDSNPSRMIRFFAVGEPTQAFGLMSEIHSYASRLAGRGLSVELQTNGHFDETVGDWVEKNVDILWISCDGPPSLQDTQRPTLGGDTSSPVVLSNVRRFASLPHMQFGVRATLPVPMFPHQVDIVEYFHQLGVRYVCAAPHYSSDVNPCVDSPPLLLFAEHFVPAFYRALDLDMFYQTHLMVNFDEEVSIYCRACTPCPHLTPDGYVSCCDWASLGPRYLSGPLQQLIYGRHDSANSKIAYDMLQIERIRNRTLSTLKAGACQHCSAIANCAGGCIGKTIVRSGDLYLPTPEWCAAVRFLFGRLPRNKGLFPCSHS